MNCESRPGVTVVRLALLGLALLTAGVPSVSGARIVDSWVKVEVLGFNGETISLRIQAYFIGNREDQHVGIQGMNFTGGESGATANVILWRGISDVIFYQDMNVTVFSYYYSYNLSYYSAGPKSWFELLEFPQDRHNISLFVRSSFETTMDGHSCTPVLPSSNYDGQYYARMVSSDSSQSVYRITLEIWHPTKFVEYVTFFLNTTELCVWSLTFALFAAEMLIILKWKDKPDLAGS